MPENNMPAVMAAGSVAPAVEAQGISTVDLKSLMGQAIQQGGTEAVEVVERLLGVAERVADREAAQAFNAAFARFSAACPKIVKEKWAGDVTDSGSKKGWWYAPLERIDAMVKPACLEHGLSYGWDSEDLGGAVRVTCTLAHVDGHSRSSVATIRKAKPNRLQTDATMDGVAMTTGQRRALMAVLGLVADDVPGDSVDPVETITEEQQVEIGNRVEQLHMNERSYNSFLHWTGAMGGVDTIPANVYESAIGRLDELIAKKAAS